MKKTIFGFLLTIFFILSVFSFNPETLIINDKVGVLTENEKTEILRLIQTLQTEIGSELAVLIVENTGDKSIEEYSLEYSENNNIGRKLIYDGLLIIISMSNRSVRIEVGYGLEKIIKDEIAGKIIRDIIVPRFVQQQYGIGLIEAIIKINTRITNDKELIGDLNGIRVY